MGEYRTSSGDIGRGIAELDANRRAAKERAMADAAAAAAKETAERERRAAEGWGNREAEAAAKARSEAAAKPTGAPAPRLAPSADDTVREAEAEAAAKARQLAEIKAQYEAARASGAPNDTVRDARDARARAPLRRVRRGERAARARDSDARRPPPLAGGEPQGALEGGVQRQDGGGPAVHRHGCRR